MRITMLIPSLQAGGAERVLSIMANYWADKGRTVTIISLACADERPFYPLHQAIIYRPLDLLAPSHTIVQAIWQNGVRMLAVRAAVRASRPDIIISLIDQMNVLSLIATTGLHVPIIVAEHNDPSQHALTSTWGTLRNWMYRRADRVIVLTPNVIAFFPASIQQRIEVIPNPVVIQQIIDETPMAPTNDKTGRTLIAMGRLDEQKGFDLLLQAFKQIVEKHPDWRLTIWGEGIGRNAIEALVKTLELDERVCLAGTTRQPFDELRRADLFVLSSRYEGFPMALCEAMAAGLPVVSFDCPSGPRDIIRDGLDGVLVPAADVDALAAALDRLMDDAAERGRLGQRAPEVVERFGIEHVMSRWGQTIQNVL